MHLDLGLQFVIILKCFVCSENICKLKELRLVTAFACSVFKPGICYQSVISFMMINVQARLSKKNLLNMTEKLSGQDLHCLPVSQ